MKIGQPSLEDSGIPVILLRTKTYDDVKRNLDVMGKVYGKEKEAAASMKSSIQKLKPLPMPCPKKDSALPSFMRRPVPWR